MTIPATLIRLLALCLALLPAVAAPALGQAKHQVRAVWLTTAYGLDWPVQGAADQRESLRAMLDVLAGTGINTVMFQCRIRGDVAYDSAIEPRNRLFKAMDFDPLAFAIDECHKRGMECHAWMVCIPLGRQGKVPRQTLTAIDRAGRGLVMSHKRQLYLDPARRGTGEYLASIAAELTSRYDIDGLHLDYIRYPDDYRAFPKAKGMTAAQKAAVRRDNITGVLRTIHAAVKSIKPWVSLSCATIGKLRSTARLNSRGWDARDCLGQDVQAWLDEGLVDAVYPMMYFKDDNFYPFAADWSEAAGDASRVIPVLGLYRIEYADQGWEADEIVRQAHFCRALGLGGIGLYRAETIVRNTRNIRGLLTSEIFTTTALPRGGRGRMDGCTIAITRAETKGRRTQLQWEYQGAAGDGVTFTIYASDTWPVDTADPANIIEAGVRATGYTYDYTYDSGRRAHFAVTATDHLGNESAPAMTPQPPATRLGVLLPSQALDATPVTR